MLEALQKGTLFPLATELGDMKYFKKSNFSNVIFLFVNKRHTKKCPQYSTHIDVSIYHIKIKTGKVKKSCW